MAAAPEEIRNRLLLITANTGSLFEEASNLEAGWVREIVEQVQQCKPAFLALHMQEIGGKNYKTCMRYVQRFIQDLQQTFAQEGYTDGQVYLDEDMDAEDRFTALGSVYFCHRSLIRRVSQYDFRRNTFIPLAGFHVHSLTDVGQSTVQKERFPKTLFSEVKWSRKGFMRTRWRLNDLVLDLVNIHLFHDACNLLAVEQSPSVYSSHRKDALLYALKELGQNGFTSVPTFIFGDFNFRLDTRSLVQSLAPMSKQLPVRDGNSIIRVEYRKPQSDQCILKIGTKTFEHEDHDTYTMEFSKLLQFDKELGLFPQLKECRISFPPSYPYCEDAESPTLYMRTRAPAWCDRVLMNDAAWNIIQNCPNTSINYNTIGQTTCMGDHKPVFLTLCLPSSLNGITPTNGDAEIFVPSWTADQLKQLAFNLAPPSESYARLLRNLEYQVYALRIESLKFTGRNSQPKLDEIEDSDDFVTIITLHDDHTATVMDASSYGLSFNASWGGSLDGSRRSMKFEDTDDRDEDMESRDIRKPFVAYVRVRDGSSSSTGSSISRQTSSTYTVSTSVSADSVEPPVPATVKTLIVLDQQPIAAGLPLHPPNQTPMMRLFDVHTDSDLVARRRSILHRYPYYSDILAIRDELGKPEAIYAKPAFEKPLPPERPKPPPRAVNGRSKMQAPQPPKRISKRIDKGVQVEFNQTFVRLSMPNRIRPRSVKHIGKLDGKFIQTDPSITDDENSLENELERRKKVGLSRWTFDPFWDIVKEYSGTQESISSATGQPQSLIDKPCVVQRRPISVGDRYLAERRRRLELDQRRSTGCSCF